LIFFYLLNERKSASGSLLSPTWTLRKSGQAKDKKKRKKKLKIRDLKLKEEKSKKKKTRIR